jgi:WD40 repeat protein
MSTRQWFRTGTVLVAFSLPAVLPPLGCGGPQEAGGCSVNGTYYPNGNAPNGQCVCPPIGSCTITFPTILHMQAAGRTNYTVTVLSADAVLITGGRNSEGEALNTADLYTPGTRTFSAIDSRMSSARTGHAATLLPDGKVLLTGGRDNTNAPLDSAELYDPANKVFTPIPSRMASPRAEHSATLLPDRTVLIAGGLDGSQALDSAEIFDPTTRTFAPLRARMVSARISHEAMLLPSGDVLLSGGQGTDGANLNSDEAYDPWVRIFAASMERRARQ